MPAVALAGVAPYGMFSRRSEKHRISLLGMDGALVQDAAPDRERCLSYQDTAVHAGTIYKAAGWTKAYESKPRIRDRSKARTGTNRMYRTNINGVEPDASAKIRWEQVL